jgi:hypothetical protein
MAVANTPISRQPFDFLCLTSITIKSPSGADIERGHWHRRAEEARVLADELTDPDAKRKMRKIAEDYEKVSIRAVQRLRHHSSGTNRTGAAMCAGLDPHLKVGRFRR